MDDAPTVKEETFLVAPEFTSLKEETLLPVEIKTK